MLDLFGRRFPRSGGWSLRAISMGLWLVGGAIATIGATANVRSSTAPEQPVYVQAGPLDDTIDYIDCLIRLLQGLDCEEEDGTVPEGEPLPEEPVNP